MRRPPLLLASATLALLAGCGQGKPAAVERVVATSAQPQTQTLRQAQTPTAPEPTATAPAPVPAPKPLEGEVVVLDPGHNGGNAAAPAQINRLVGIGQGQRKACNTTGTATNGGYAEAAYTWDLAKRTRAVLKALGASVVLTRSSNTGIGPCVDARARIATRAGSDATVSIHADGAAAGARGFHVIEPARIKGLTDDVLPASHRLALDLRAAFKAGTGEPYATYIATNGLMARSDLGGLRLADTPSVFIETGNMRNATDAARMTSASYRARAARALAAGIQRYVLREG